ncbi:aminopeptidase N-like isoform X2 [Choristoneura fumiferana]|uniref:aminopeptidase N-like isoform X2 n=1 Tax=Choristoneura fumiferana TaxID=7141 RepID=UPI003D1580F9
MIRVFFSLCLMASASAYITTSLVIDEECLNFTVYPVQYELIIKPTIFKNQLFFYDCDMVITVIANAPEVTMIELDAKDLVINETVVYRDHTNIINVNTPFTYDRVNGKLKIYLNEPLRVYKRFNTQYQVRIWFKKIVRYDTPGVFAVRYDDDIEGEKYMILTRLSRNHAKYFFPCFDNNRFEAVFKFKINTIPGERGMQYINSSLVIAEEQRRMNRNNYIFIEYQPSPQVSLNEIGFVYSQFSNASMRARNTNDTIVIWAPGPTMIYYNYILKFGQSIMNLIHEYSTIDRPIMYGPINIVAVPSNLNGYEIGSWNLLTNGYIRLAYVPELTSIRQLEKMTFELTQQLCRIWLGNPGEHPRTTWKEEWFKEGVATYFAYYFLGKYHHNGESYKTGWPYGFYGLEMRHRAMLVDWHHSTPSLINFNRTLAVEIPPRYTELMTMKTASLLWMVENWIGTEKFHAALVKYINKRRGSYISIEDFMINLDKETVECFHQFFNGSTSSRVLDSWIHQSGYPVINVEVFRDRSPNVILLKQRKFMFTKEFRYDTKFLIPISYVIQHNQNCYNCHQPRFTISTSTYSFAENLNGGWIILNRRASGYYRVNYDADTWLLIAKTLQENHLSIDELNRAQIVSDVFALYAAGDLSYELAVEILSYLDKEQSYAVWESAITGFELLKIEYAACDFTKALYEEWQQFMRRNVKAIYDTLVEDLEQQQQRRLFRSNIITFACAVQYEPCLHRVRQLYTQQLGRLDPDSRQACYYTVLSDHSGALMQNLTWFEDEDRQIATNRMREESRLMYRLPPGMKTNANLFLNATTHPSSRPSAPAPQTRLPGSSGTLQTSIVCILVAYLFTTIF